MMSLSELFCEQPICTVNQAARHGNVDALKKLIQKGHPVDVPDNRGWKPTHEAADGNYVECLKVLLEQEVTDLRWRSFEGCTALLLAARQGHRETTKLLLQHGADPNIADCMDEYPLLAAVKTTNLACVELLLDSNADVNCQLYCGTSPLHQAASEGLTDIVAVLLDHGAKLDIKEDYNITPIFPAAQYGKTECLKLLLEKAKTTDSSLVNSTSDDNATALYLAAQEGHIACVQLLLDYGADANILTKEPESLPLLAALEFNRLECVKKLLPVTLKSEVAKCVLCPFYFSMAHDDGCCTKCLIDAGYDANAKLRDGDEGTLFFFPAEPEDLAVELFENSTPLAMVGSCNYSLRNAQILLEAGASVNAKTNGEVPPLFTALAAGNTQLAKMLIQCGASVNVCYRPVTGHKSILFTMHHWETLDLMLRAGTDVCDLFGPCPPYVKPVLEEIPEDVHGFSFSKVKSVIRKAQPLTPDCDLKSISAKVQDIFISELDNMFKELAATNQLAEGIHTVEQPGVGLPRTHVEKWARTVSKIGLWAMKPYFVALQKIGHTPHIGRDLARKYLKPWTKFHELLQDSRCIKRLKDGGTRSMTAWEVLQRMLQFTGNVPLDLTLAALVDTQEEWISLVTLIENPRRLAHYARLAVRKCLTPAQLINHSTMATLSLPVIVVDYLMFQDEDESA